MQNISDKLSQHIRQKALHLRQVSQAVKATLPLDCHSHIEVAGIKDNQLIILTDSPVWQTRLRMLSQSMLEALLSHTGIQLSSVKLKLTPPKRSIPEVKPASRILSQASAVVIEQTASSISDPELRKAMQRLSLKARKPAV